MLQYKGFLVDDNLNIYSARTGMQLTPTKGSSGNRIHKNKTKVNATDRDGNIFKFNSIRELGKELHLGRHKVARILKGEIDNYYDYDFDYAM